MVTLKPDQVGRAGEYFVAAEIIRRGGYAVTFSGNRITIQVKAKSAGDWQTSTTRGRRWDDDPSDGRYWVLVDIGQDHPALYVMSAHWIENDIATAHADNLDRNDGKRAVSNSSTHHSIATKRVHEWLDRWDLLGILPPT